MYTVLFFILLADHILADFNFTYSMASRCKEHICQKGHVYETFYRIDHESQKLPPGVDFEMHIAILASSNGHILLSSIPDPDIDSPVYEIVVGGGANKFSEIRRNKGKNAKNSANTLGILSPIEFRAFYIRISDGTIEFGKENSSLPLLSYHDVDSLTINYFSFASWAGVEAKYLYDCPAPGEYGSTEQSPNSTLVDKVLTNSARLKMFLLNDRSAYTAPDPEILVGIDFKVTTLSYNAFESILTVGVSVSLYWNDATLAWNPSKFNDTTNLRFKEGEIWRPSFIDSYNLGAFGERDPEPIYVVNSGDATIHIQHTFVTYCNDTDLYAKRWPRDEYICEIIFGPLTDHETIKMQAFSAQNKTKILSTVSEVIQNDWELISTKLEIIEGTNTVKSSHKNASDKMKVIVHIRRKALAYNLVFYTPLLVLVTFLLLSFWTEPLVMNRIWFYTGCVTFLCMGLSYIDYFIPTHTVPTILILYVCVLMGTLIALLTQAILINPSISRIYKWNKLDAFISHKAVQCIFGLRTTTDGELPNIYERINEDAIYDGADSGVDSFPRNQGNNIEELQPDNSEKAIGQREQLAEIIDKSMFTVYSVVFAVLLGMHY